MTLNANTRCWIALCLSIMLEVSGTSLMKLFQASSPFIGMTIMYGCLGLAYLLLSRATLGIPVGVAYAFWEGAGLVLISTASVLLLGEDLTLKRFLGLCCVMGGTLLVHHGTDDDGEAESQDHARHGHDDFGAHGYPMRGAS